jgi:hypothetical protein
MKPVIALVFALLLFWDTSFAQKNAPVIGDAATLIDLLRKNYDGIAPDNRDDEIAKDRTAAIGIFKKYLPRESAQKLTTIDAKLSEKQTELDKAKHAMALFNSTSQLNNQTMAKYSSLTEEVVTKSQAYKRGRYTYDSAALKTLYTSYNSDNKFIATVIDLFQKKYESLNNYSFDQFAVSSNDATQQKSIPFIGGDLSFETVIDGLSRFIAGRIKEELTNYVIDAMKKQLDNPSPDNPFEELKILLPRTTQYFRSFTADHITNFSGEVKQYIEDDLDNMLANAANLRNAPRIAALIKNYPDIDFAFEAMELVPNLSKIKYPIDYFTMMESSRNITRWKDDTNTVKHNIANMVIFSSMLAQSLTVVENSEPQFISTDMLGDYFKDDNFYFLYLGFLRQQCVTYYRDINIKTNKTAVWNVRDGFNDIVKDTAKLKASKKFVDEVLTSVTENAEKLYETAIQIKKAKKAGSKIGADTIYAFVNSMIDFSEEMTSTTQKVYSSIRRMADSANYKPIDFIGKTASYFAIARGTNNIVHDLQNKKYASAMVKGLELSENFMPKGVDELSNLGDRITQLTSGQSKFAHSWYVVNEALRKIKNDSSKLSIWDPFKKELNVKDEFAQAAGEIEFQIALIQGFCNTEYPDSLSALRKQIGEMRDLLHAMASNSLSGFKTSGGNNAAYCITNAQKLLENPNFQRLVISYYAGTSIDIVVKDAVDQMKQLKIRGVQVLDDQAAKSLTTDALACANAAFQNYFIEGNKDESKDLKQARGKLQSTVASYAILMPERFKLTDNSTVLSFVHLVNDMAQAKNSEDMEKAFEAFALPSGSYAIKRTARSNVSINTYPGIFYTREVKWDDIEGPGSLGSALWNKSVAAPSFTAPVGISWTRGSRGYIFRKKWDIGAKNWSWGVFVPIIDIGAITRFRLDNDTATNVLPELKFQNVFSPGIYAHIGLRNTPITLHFGAQYGPTFKEIQKDGSALSFESIRWGGGIVLDIPLVNLHTKPWDK